MNKTLEVDQQTYSKKVRFNCFIMDGRYNITFLVTYERVHACDADTKIDLIYIYIWFYNCCAWHTVVRSCINAQATTKHM